MHVSLAYGKSGLDVTVPDNTDVLQATQLPGLASETDGLRHALRHPIQNPPLAAQVDSSSRIVIVHTDITRATPNDRILPVLLQELLDAGVPPAQITLINALGTHRPQTAAELRTMLGDWVYSRFRCVQHDAFDDSLLVDLGTTSFGHPVRVHHLLVESDLRILTGFIEPHFFAGFSGGPKGVLPSLAGFESVLSNHSRAMIAHPRATWGNLEGNPIWQEMREVALKLPDTFLLNVTMNARKEITGVFAGDLIAAHDAGCRFVRDHSMVAVTTPYDLVIACNSGYPLDQNLYQSVKGMSAASQIVRQGGTIIMAAECADGIPDHGQYAALLRQGGSPAGVLAMLAADDFAAHDQWQVQIQAQIQLKADVYFHSHLLSTLQIREALLQPCPDVSALVATLCHAYSGPDPMRICVMPDGPMTIAYLAPDTAPAGTPVKGQTSGPY